MYLNKVIEKTPFKRSIDDLDLFDLPMVGVFKDKRFAAYTLSTLAGVSDHVNQPKESSGKITKW